MSIVANQAYLMMQTARLSDYQARWQNNNEAMMSAAWNVTGNESMGDIARLQQSDKAMALNNAQLQFGMQATQAQLEATQAMMKKYWEQRRQAIQNGFLF